MKLIEFPEQNLVIARNQPQYRPLPAYKYKEDLKGSIICCWKPTWKERFLILFGKPIWHNILTFNQPLQPQLLSLDKPKMPKWIA